MTTQQITVGSKSFSVETSIGHDGRNHYTLTGPRGATYGILRTRINPNLMHVINIKGQTPREFTNVMLTDVSGLVQVA